MSGAGHCREESWGRARPQQQEEDTYWYDGEDDCRSMVLRRRCAVREEAGGDVRWGRKPPTTQGGRKAREERLEPQCSRSQLLLSTPSSFRSAVRGRWSRKWSGAGRARQHERRSKRFVGVLEITSLDMRAGEMGSSSSRILQAWPSKGYLCY
jgi:hypothetical protein